MSSFCRPAGPQLSHGTLGCLFDGSERFRIGPDRFGPVPGESVDRLQRHRRAARSVGMTAIDEPTYGLNELARAARVSKSTLLDLLETGQLDGERSPSGRREWRISHSAATQAGLHISTPPTVDSAIRACVASELDRIDDRNERRYAAVIERLDRIDSQLERSGTDACAASQRSRRRRDAASARAASWWLLVRTWIWGAFPGRRSADRPRQNRGLP